MRMLIVGFLLFSLSACASNPVTPPVLANRSLRISPDLPGFEYQYEVCLKTFLGICTKRQWTKDTYDLTDIATRNKLIDMGFIGVVREKIVP